MGRPIIDEAFISENVTSSAVTPAQNIADAKSVSIETKITEVTGPITGEIFYEKSNSPEEGNWKAIAAAQVFTGNTIVWYQVSEPEYKSVRVRVEVSSGEVNIRHDVFSKGSW